MNEETKKMNELLRKGREIIGEIKPGSYQYFPEEYWTDTNDEEWGMEIPILIRYRDGSYHLGVIYSGKQEEEDAAICSYCKNPFVGPIHQDDELICPMCFYELFE